MAKKILFLISSAREIKLRDGSAHETGFFAEEAIKPYDHFIAGGCEVDIATPDGKSPHADSYGLDLIFHYPDEDEDFLSSVTRSFMPDVDDIRITLEHLTELDLIAARRVFVALQDAGLDAGTARRSIELVALCSWFERRNFIDLLADDSNIVSRVSAAKLRACAKAVQDDAKRNSAAHRERLATIPGMSKPIALDDLTDDRILQYDAVFVPGGHGPMVDLYNNPQAGRLLKVMHESGRTIAALCHGPAVLLSAPWRPDGLWLFDGYKMTAFSDEEEDQTKVGKLGMSWYLETALKNRGGVFDDGFPWLSHVTVDRNLITGQNPASADATAEAVLKHINSRDRRMVA